jgi:glycosyltransferase involved in cell wall biosynthesis
MMAKIAIYTPFLPFAGGGERYMLTLANALQHDHQVAFLSNFPEDYRKLSLQLEIDTTATRFLELNLRDLRVFQRQYSQIEPFDLFICLSNHIYPPIQGMGKANVLMVQFPYPYGKKELLTCWQERQYGSAYQYAIVNSKFTETHVRKISNLRTQIIYPPVEIDQLKFADQAQKQNQILSVGRFIAGKDSKRQLEMVQCFKKLCDQYPDLSLHYVCAGSTRSEPIHQDYIEKLQTESTGYPITLLFDIPVSQLVDLYQQSRFFWHAKGWGAAHDRPEFTEHFGISTVEAMASGCIPLVFQAGGQLEIVNDGQNGFLWQTEADLIQKTVHTARNSKLAETMSHHACDSAKRFSGDRFQQEVRQFVEGLLVNL